MQDELTISLKEKDAAVIKAQKEACEAATSADQAKQQADEAVASAKANSEQECKRAQVAANRAIDEYKEHINQVHEISYNRCACVPARKSHPLYTVTACGSSAENQWH
jgi:sensor c-di-GMP phosphodiesterase-like protein